MGEQSLEGGSQEKIRFTCKSNKKECTHHENKNLLEKKQRTSFLRIMLMTKCCNDECP